MRRGCMLVLLGAYLLLSERVFVHLNSGGRGLLPLLPLLVPLVAFLCVGLLTKGQHLAFLQKGRFWLGCGLFAACGLLLPMLGILLAGYEARHLLAVFDGVLPLSFVALGYSICRAEGPRRMYQLLFAVMVVQAGYALLQFLGEYGFWRSPLLTALAEWDRSSQSAYSEFYVLSDRSTGTFINPNVLGFWAVGSLWVSILLLGGWQRVLGLAASMLTLALSQSRGSVVAAAVSFGIWFLAGGGIGLFRRSASSRLRRERLRPIIGVALLGTATMLGCGPTLQSLGGMESLQRRMMTGASVLTGGVGQDKSLEARVLAWRRATTFLADSPAGTLGPPQLRFGSFIDNEFVRIALQGGPLYLMAAMCVLVLAWKGLLRTRPESQVLGALGVCIAVNGMTALPLASPASAVFWIVFGAALVPARTQEPSDD